MVLKKKYIELKGCSISTTDNTELENKIEKTYSTSEDCRCHLRTHRFQGIGAYIVGSYAAMTDKELQDSVKTIQQLLVEYGVLFGGGPIDSTDENAAYGVISYVTLHENQFNIGGSTTIIS